MDVVLSLGGASSCLEARNAQHGLVIASRNADKFGGGAGVGFAVGSRKRAFCRRTKDTVQYAANPHQCRAPRHHQRIV